MDVLLINSYNFRLILLLLHIVFNNDQYKNTQNIIYNNYLYQIFDFKATKFSHPYAAAIEPSCATPKPAATKIWATKPSHGPEHTVCSTFRQHWHPPLATNGKQSTSLPDEAPKFALSNKSLTIQFTGTASTTLPPTVTTITTVGIPVDCRLGQPPPLG